jgi:hypothetical protein
MPVDRDTSKRMKERKEERKRDLQFLLQVFYLSCKNQRINSKRGK